ncbi:MAG: alanine--tRNA ligase [Candidatus Brockarchaeota archaeon]|nr:alanine--tRNA ligase [Candidatus Brockarchaeota archaeon]
MSKGRFGEEEYRLSVFKELGYERRLCEKEGEYYWVPQEFKGECGESPTVKYEFIDNPIGYRTSSLEEVRNLFLGFFSSKSHKVIDPYPVVARWRSDLYLTDASIVDFQPYVTEGMIPPPANPLVVSQPCIRLLDLDNVGTTFGRHMSIFEMGGHHAFNDSSHEVYWKDETVRYSYEFITKIMKIPREKILYKESYWSGGGNAGPCFEVIVGGLEVATLVFMRFKVERDGSLSELPIRTVDTGYGIERFLWVASGALSSMFVVHPKAIQYILEEGKISYDEDLIKKYVVALSGVDPTLPLSQIRTQVAKVLNVKPEFLEKQISPLEKAFKIVDHSKSLVFILSEGVVPSNVGVGYLARLLFRRIARNMRSLGILDDLIPLLDLQVNYWSRWFRTLGEQKDEIIKVASVEFQKYKRNYERTSSLILKELDASKNYLLTPEKLVELYDSHGFTPEEVNDVLQFTRGISVEIPVDFYKNIAARHAKNLVTQVKEQEFPKEILNYEETKKKYYEDPNLEEFSATVLGVFEPNIVLLGETIFYPEGGGQPSDKGTMERESGEKLNVTNVINYKNRILHFVEGNLPKVGEKVKLRVDMERRWAIRRAHTATHIINWASRNILGAHVWQHGAQKDVNESRLDITHYEGLTEEEIEKIEKLANELVLKALPVKIEYLMRTEAERRYGFRIYQGGVVPAKEIIIVSIGNYEVEACGGLHVENTGQIGLIKIIHAEKIQDGVVRLIFTSGLSSLKLLQEDENIVRKLEKLLKVSKLKLLEQSTNFLKELEELKSKVEEYKEKEIKEVSVSLVNKAERKEGFNFIFYVANQYNLDEIIKIGENVSKLDEASVCFILSTMSIPNDFVIVYGKESKIPSKLRAGDLAKIIGKEYGGGGGGKDKFGKGGLVNNIDLERLKQRVLGLLIFGIEGGEKIAKA